MLQGDEKAAVSLLCAPDSFKLHYSSLLHYIKVISTMISTISTIF